MKKIIFHALLIIGTLGVSAQNDKAAVLQSLETNNTAGQNIVTTATLKASSRLFGVRDDIASVIMIIPSGSVVDVLGSDSTYLHVRFEDNEGYIFKRQATIDKTPVVKTEAAQNNQAAVPSQPPQEQLDNRYTYLVDKYGASLADKLFEGKIWKGMTSEMVKDSWGTADKINRVISSNVIKEEWIYKNTWLYFENNILVQWGPVKK
jgi:hypothetical protein